MKAGGQAVADVCRLMREALPNLLFRYILHIIYIFIKT